MYGLLPPPQAAPDAVSATASQKTAIVRLTHLTIQQATAAHPEGEPRRNNAISMS